MLSVSLSPRQLIILYKTEKEAEQAPLQNNLPGGSKLGRGLQGLLRHFQAGVLTPGFMSKKVQLPHGTVLQGRVSLCINLREVVEHRVLGGQVHLLVPCVLISPIVPSPPWSPHLLLDS